MGVGGTAMAAIAGMFRKAGCQVRGSDAAPPYPPMNGVLDGLGIEVLHPYSGDNLDWDPELVVVGNVIRATNPEAEALRDSGIHFLSMPQALRTYFLEERIPLVIAGTHGKTTTASLIAHLLNGQGMDPSFMIGGIPLDFGTNYRLGQGAHFVVEGDEYDTAFFDKGPKFLHYAPRAAIITNVEFDHADIFRDLDHVIETFHALSEIMPFGSPLVIPAGDENCLRAVEGTGARLVTFGLDTGTWQPALIRRNQGRVRFTLNRGADRIGEFESPLLGDHNLANMVAALALLHEVEAATKDLAEPVASFRGIRKRQEVKGVENGVTVMDDFAHHPTAVRETLRAIRSGHPGARVIALFEPESNTSRRAVFQADYATAFLEADRVLFATPLEKDDNLKAEERIDMARLCADIRAGGVPADMIPDVTELAKTAAREARPGDVILGMSGRDFNGVHALVLEALGRSRLDTGQP